MKVNPKNLLDSLMVKVSNLQPDGRRFESQYGILLLKKNSEIKIRQNNARFWRKNVPKKNIKPSTKLKKSTQNHPSAII